MLGEQEPYYVARLYVGDMLYGFGVLDMRVQDRFRQIVSIHDLPEQAMQFMRKLPRPVDIGQCLIYLAALTILHSLLC